VKRWLIFLAACGSSTAPVATPAAPVGRPCVHEAEPVPASCIDASARGKLLKDDHDNGVRIWQACAGGVIIEGDYAAEKVGNARNDREELTTLLDAHRKDVWATGVISADVRACGGAGDPSRCIDVAYQSSREDVPAVMARLAKIFATDQDVCVPFRIDTGVPAE
jgi:hypothetical protein